MMEDSFCSALLRLSRHLSRQLNSKLRDVELTGEQAVMLDAIDVDPAPRVTDLCLALGVDASTVSANLKPLIARSLVTVIADLADARARRLHLTLDGRHRLRIAQQVLGDLDVVMKRKLKESGALEDVTLALRRLSHTL